MTTIQNKLHKTKCFECKKRIRGVIAHMNAKPLCQDCYRYKRYNGDAEEKTPQNQSMTKTEVLWK